MPSLRRGCEHPVLGISKHFFGSWCKGKAPQVCTLVQSDPLSWWSEVKTSAASALQPGCALIHLGGSWEPALISGCVCGSRRRTLVKSRKNRSRFCLHEHILHNWSSMKLHQWNEESVSRHKNIKPLETACLWPALMAGLSFQHGPSCAAESGHLQTFKLSFPHMGKGIDSEVRHSKILPVMWTSASDLLIWKQTNSYHQLIGAEKHWSSHLPVQLRGNSTCIWHFVSQAIKIRSL